MAAARMPAGELRRLESLADAAAPSSVEVQQPLHTCKLDNDAAMFCHRAAGKAGPCATCHQGNFLFACPAHDAADIVCGFRVKDPIRLAPIKARIDFIGDELDRVKGELTLVKKGGE